MVGATLIPLPVRQAAFVPAPCPAEDERADESLTVKSSAACGERGVISQLPSQVFCLFALAQDSAGSCLHSLFTNVN